MTLPRAIIAAQEILAAPPMQFAKSESKVVGVRGGWLDTLRDNSPRVVATIKMGLDVTLGLSGDPFMMAYAGLAIVGRIIAIAYGTKANQQKQVEEAAREGRDLGKEAAETSTVNKVLQPRKFPVESSAGLSVVAETFGVGYGISQFAQGGTGFTPVILGLVAVWSYFNILTGKEAKTKSPEKEGKEKSQDSLVFAKSESKAVGWYDSIRQKMKDNPVFTSSLVNIGLTICMAIGGLIEGLPTWYVAAAGIGIAANAIQAMLVRKNEFNIEGAQQEKEQPQHHVEKITQSRRNPGLDMPHAPAFS